jgi:hypothetical protein
MEYEDIITKLRELCQMATPDGYFPCRAYERDLILSICDMMERSQEELKIVYELADNMFNETYMARRDYENWRNAGQLVDEEDTQTITIRTDGTGKCGDIVTGTGKCG